MRAWNEGLKWGRAWNEGLKWGFRTSIQAKGWKMALFGHFSVGFCHFFRHFFASLSTSCMQDSNSAKKISPIALFLTLEHCFKSSPWYRGFPPLGHIFWCASFGGFYWLPVYIVASLLPQFRCASFGGFHCLPPCMPNSLLPHLGVQVLTVLLLTIFFVTIVLLCKFCHFINLPAP